MVVGKIVLKILYTNNSVRYGLIQSKLQDNAETYREDGICDEGEQKNQ